MTTAEYPPPEPTPQSPFEPIDPTPGLERPDPDTLCDHIEQSALGQVIFASLNGAVKRLGMATPVVRVLELDALDGRPDLSLPDLFPVPPGAYHGVSSASDAAIAAFGERCPGFTLSRGVAGLRDLPDGVPRFGFLMAAIIAPQTMPSADLLSELNGALAPGGFLVLAIHGTPFDPEEAAARCVAAGFPVARPMPLMQAGDAEFVKATVAAFRTAEPNADADREHNVMTSIVEDLMHRAGGDGRSRAFAAFVPARWRVLIALKAAPRVVMPGGGSGPGVMRAGAGS